MNNREFIQEELIRNGVDLKISEYDSMLDKLTQTKLYNMVKDMGFGTCDIRFEIEGELYVLEVYEYTEEQEIGFYVISDNKHLNRYGREPEVWREKTIY